MGRKIILYGAGLIALYLVVVNYKGTVADAGAGSKGATNLVKAFQGR